MRARLYSISALVVALCLSIVSLSGCTTTRRNVQIRNQSGTTQQGRNITGKNIIGTNPTNMPTPGVGRLSQTKPHQTSFDSKKADIVQRDINAMPEIRSSHVIVHGDTALVGFTPSGVTKDVNTIKSMIVSRVKQVDSSITKVSVSESTDIMTKMRQLSNDIKSNKPLNDLKTRFTHLIQGISPAHATPAGRT